jgi:FAD/FMN-containing dehydrogenase
MGAIPDTILSELKAAAGPKGWTQDPAVLAPHLAEWRGRWTGATPIMLSPATTGEVARIVTICARERIPITPQGGNTGLVGGATPQGEILLSLRRMTLVRAVDPLNDAMTVEAGVTLLGAQEAAKAAGRLFPLSLGAEGLATVGGAISTNAGGVAVLRYGMMRDLVLGIEAVLADGRVFEGLRSLRKDNTGYDLKQLFIGAEGTLGVVTAATLKLFPRPAARAVALAGIGDVAAAIRLLAVAKDESGGAVTGFEILPRPVLDLVLKHMERVRDPLTAPHPWYALIEMSFGREDGARETMESALAAGVAAGLVRDAVVAQSETDAAAFWRLRELAPEAERADGPAIKHDVSVPVAAMPDLYARGCAAVAAIVPEGRVLCFGHAGDGNFHFNIAAPRENADAFWAKREAITEAVHEAAAALGGSISAEHGVGIMKKAEIARRKSAVEMDMMRAVKAALDPKGIMNPRVLLAGR